MGGVLLNQATVPGVESLRIQMRVDADRTLLVLDGELDAFGAANLQRWLTGDVILDMADVTFVDSQGVRAIARAARDRRLVIRDPSDVVRRVLGLVGLLGLLE